jgi:hypothetical protein
MKCIVKPVIGKHLSDNSPIQYDLKQGDCLLLLLFNFALEYTIRKAQETQMGLKLNGRQQLLAYADDVNLLRDNIDTIRRNTENLIDASKEVGLEVNASQNSRHKSSKHNLKMWQFSYLGMTAINPNLIDEEIMRSDPGNV